jgi:hypothetical protein
MDARITQIAPISVESVRSQQANIVAWSRANLENRVTFLADGADELPDKFTASNVPIVKLIAGRVCLIEFVATEFAPVVGIIRRKTHLFSPNAFW